MQALGSKMVFAKVNGWEDTLMAEQRGVKGYPTLILMRPDGSEIDRIPGYAPPDEFLKTIDDYLAGRNTLDDLRSRFAAHPDSLDLLMQIGEKYQYRGMDAQAESTYAEFLRADPDNRTGQADKVLSSLARVAYSAGEERYDTAIARYNLLLERFPKSEMAEDAATWVPYILARQEKYAEALILYEEFLKNFPESGEADWVRLQIEDIKSKAD